jgi:hypothetical protein
MIPILQFDPSSLTFWYDTHLINRSRGAESIGKALDFALRGRDAELQTHILGLTEPWVQTRAANVSSAVWHEKRHFLDFVLTNYGALRMRQFFMIYANLPTVIRASQKAGHLLVPVQSYLNPQICRVLGVKSPPPEVLTFAKDILARKRMLEDDRGPVPSRFGRIEVGGEALLEAIAYFVQTGKVHRTLGVELCRRVQQDHPNHELVSRRYSWAIHILVATGLLSVAADVDAVDGWTTLLVNDGPFIPLCYAALACRLWKQEQTYAEHASSYLPKYRLASLGIHLKGRASEISDLTSAECWEILNKECAQLFGRSVIEEMFSDYDHEEKLIDMLRKQGVYETFTNAYEDYHNLRGKLLGVLKTSPELIIDQACWSDKMVKKLQPMVIVAATSGELGSPPPDYERVLGYRDSNMDTKEVPEATWWWAACPSFWPEMDRQEIFCLADRKSWLGIVSEFAPVAKLLLDGRRTRTMLGPELIRAETYLTVNHKMKVVIDPRFAFPRQEISADYWRYATGSDTFRCDLSYETVHWPEACIIDPWAVRLKSGLLEALLGDLQNNYVKYLNFWRDWSPWVVSEEFRDVIQGYEDNPRPLNPLLET